MDVIVAYALEAWGILLSGKWAVMLGGSIQLIC